MIFIRGIDDMYNETTKRAFISTLSSKQNVLLATSLFNNIEIFEQESGKDISLFTAEALQKVQFKIGGSKTYSSRQQDASTLRSYLDWAFRHSICSTNMSSYVLQAMDINANTVLVSSPLHLQFQLDTVFASEVEDTVDLLSRGFIWMAYMGIPKEDTIQITDSHVCEYGENKEKVISYNGILYKIPTEACITINKLCILKYLTSTTSSGVVRKFDRVQGNVLLRGTTRLNHITVEYLRTRITRKSKEYRLSKVLSYASLYKSGVFYRQYMLEQQGLIPTFTELMSSRSYYRENKKTDIYFQDKLKAIHGEYTAWKDKYYSLV